MTSSVAFIDDNPTTLDELCKNVRLLGCESEVYTPDLVDEALLKKAHLFVVDNTLDDWIDHVEADQLSLKPINGTALAAVLRQHSLSDHEFPPTGFTLITGDPGKLGDLPAERRPHIISRLGNIEWYFEKGMDDARNAQKIKSLADAIVGIPSSVAHHLGDIRALMAYLGADGHPLQERFEASVQKCRPPIHYLSKQSDGLIVIRWLLHRILPYTTFLMDELSLAARLRIEPKSLQSLLTPDSVLVNQLRDIEYKGPLSDFDGARWWRDGVEQFLWEVTKGSSSNATAIHESLRQIGIADLEPTNVKQPVLTVNHELKCEANFSDMSAVVPMQLDDWPSYAEPPYVRKEELADHHEMQMFVVP